MKNVLFIVYYFPPMGGSGVQRPLKFVKYLREFGWNPIVLCPEPGIYPYFDEELEAELKELDIEIIRVQPKTLFHVGGEKSSTKKRLQVPNLLAKIARRFLRLFMYPDNKKGWIKPAVEKGKQLLESHDIQAIFSTAPPFSNHIIGKELCRSSGIPLALDYRDAWLQNHFMDGMFGWQKSIMRNQELECLQEAEAVIGLDDFMLRQITREYSEISVQAEVIPHGFDPRDFSDHEKPTIKYKSGKLNFLYSGLFYESNQPDIFLQAIKQAINEEQIPIDEIHLHFQGGLDRRIHSLVKELGLQEVVSDYGYQPHKTAVANLKQADVLWMISNFDTSHKQVKSGKLFEYFGSAKPILGLVHEGEEARLLREYGAGFLGSLKSEKQLGEEIAKIYSHWEKGELPNPNQEFIAQFNRRKLTQNLGQLFDKISSQ